MCKLIQGISNKPIETLTLIASILALAAALYIPRKIMVNQIYADLLREYRSAEMGEAIMGLIDFYVDTCDRNVSLIDEKFREQFNVEIKCVKKRGEKPDVRNSLHFKRRLLWQYYWHLSTLRYEYFFEPLSKKRLKKNFTETESRVIAILHYTVQAVKDLSEKTGDIPEPEEAEGKTEEMMYRLYEESREW
jgi:hypothetical protein